MKYIDRKLIHRWNADANNVCDVRRAHHVRGAPPQLVSDAHRDVFR